MYPGYCASVAHIELLGIKSLINAIIREVKEGDRRRLHRAKRQCFALCDEVGKLFDEAETMFIGNCAWAPRISKDFIEKLSAIHEHLGLVTKSDWIRAMSSRLYDVMTDDPDSRSLRWKLISDFKAEFGITNDDEASYSNLISDFMAGLGRMEASLSVIKNSLEREIAEYDRKLKRKEKRENGKNKG